MNEWYFTQPVIDYHLLAEAIDHYSLRGYRYIETPWAVDHRYTDATKPAGRRDFYCLDGYLVASGEQSFMSAMHSGELQPGNKYQTITPCFRDEAVDELHQTWFLKLELIWYSPSLPVRYSHVHEVMNDANQFMSRHIKTQRTSPGDQFEDPTSEHGAYTGPCTP
jgi:seryl-tRNA synthetase